MPGRRAPSRRTGSVTGGASPAQGSLVLSTTALSFSSIAGNEAEEYADDAFTLSNGGPGNWANPQVEITYGVGSGWLSLATAAGTSGTFTYTPTLDASALSANTYTATITFTDTNVSNSGQTVDVTFVVAAAAPRIGFSTPALAFTVVDETSGAAQAVTVSNIGTGTLAVPTVGSITYGSGTATGWLGTPVVSGSSPGPYTITFTPDATGATVGGPYTASVPILSTGATNTGATLSIEMTVTSGQVAILAFDRSLDDKSWTIGDAAPSNATVVARNVGQGTLAQPVVDSTTYSGSHSGWATATFSGNTLTTVIDPTGIVTSGQSTARIVASSATSATTATYDVFFKAGTPPASPTISVAPTTVSVTTVAGTSPGTRTITVGNAGGGSLGTVTATVVTGGAWMSVAFSVNTATITFSSASLAAGTYNGSINIAAATATNTPVTVPVSLVVSAVAGVEPNPLAALPTWSTFDNTDGSIDNAPFADKALSYFS